MAGRKVRCPSCNAVLVVPQPKPAGDVEEEALQLLLGDPEPKASAIRSEPPAAVSPIEQGIRRADPAPGLAKPPPSVEKGKRRRPKTGSRDRDSEGSGFSIAVNPEITSGLLMMAGGAIWFFLGLAGGRIFIYAPILFVLGIGAVIRGFTGND